MEKQTSSSRELDQKPVYSQVRVNCCVIGDRKPAGKVDLLLNTLMFQNITRVDAKTDSLKGCDDWLRWLGCWVIV